MSRFRPVPAQTSQPYVVDHIAEHPVGAVEAASAGNSMTGSSMNSFVEVPDAGHAPMLDRPLALVSGIRSVLADGADGSAGRDRVPGIRERMSAPQAE